MTNLKSLTAALAGLKSQLAKDDLAGAARSVTKSKLMMVQVGALVDPGYKSVDSSAERAAATGILEQAVLMCARSDDSEGFDRHMQQLKVLYFDFNQFSASSDSTTLLGLNLLKLLKEGRVPEFFMELELIPKGSRGLLSPGIKFVVQLQDNLTEGKYEEFLKLATTSPPSPSFRPYLESLEETAREEIARCLSLAYTSLPIQQACSLLLLDPSTQLDRVEPLLRAGLGEAMDIVTEGSGPQAVIRFIGEDTESKFGPQQRHGVIAQALNYANELEKII